MSAPKPLSYSQLFWQVMHRDLKVAVHNKGDFLNPLIFLVIVITLFPLGVGPETNLLTRIAPGIIWVAALLSALLSLERLFKNDYSDGTLEQMLLSPQPLFIMVLAKISAHWLLTGLPIILIAPLLALMLHMETLAYPALMITLALGTPVLSLIGAIGVALTVGLKKGGVLLSLLILPLYIPVLIFATAAIEAAALSMPYSGHIAIISALLVLALTLSPFAVSAALRVSTN
ncbi:heme exporter protein CcmB [Psychrobium sp. MM17-31]|uniref:heme exporter protein CcmB n=1 Tax=Psychrobium sp. MM17-31 TaxID=2917758 RepID=UPI001EF4DB41|nr:heme exporter protein CcmB [Psychrobium sp. MM17-31]MCG7532593.1 heme exporter protein CcmB [Psychrobium sp. MM17-31]